MITTTEFEHLQFGSRLQAIVETTYPWYLVERGEPCRDTLAGYHCTRLVGHDDGPHVAHGGSGRAYAWWPRMTPTGVPV